MNVCMVILEADRQRIEDVADLGEAFGDASPEQGLLLLVQASKGTKYVVLTADS